jgi:hypothetical protein
MDNEPVLDIKGHAIAAEACTEIGADDDTDNPWWPRLGVALIVCSAIVAAAVIAAVWPH